MLTFIYLFYLHVNFAFSVREVCRLAGDRDRLLALFSFTSGPTSSIISEFAATFQLPVVSVSSAVDESLRRRFRRMRPVGVRRASSAELGDTEILHHHDEMPFAVHVRPLYTSAVIDVIRHYQWQHVFYVFDNAEGRQRRKISCTVVVVVVVASVNSNYRDHPQTKQTSKCNRISKETQNALTLEGPCVHSMNEHYSLDDSQRRVKIQKNTVN